GAPPSRGRRPGTGERVTVLGRLFVSRPGGHGYGRPAHDSRCGTRLDPSVLAREVAVLDANRAHRRVVQRAVEPFRALARLPALAFPGGLVVARALRGPASEVRS